MSNTKLSNKVVAQSLSPLLIPFITIIGTELFSSVTQKWGDSIIQVIGGKIILLICLFLIAGILSLYILLKNSTKLSIQTIQPQVSNSYNESDIRKRRESLIRNLGEDEKDTLRLFINGKKKNIKITIGYGNVSSLLSNGIINRITQITVGGMVEYTISDWAWEMLNKHPDYLK
jgi:hypothetical protein